MKSISNSYTRQSGKIIRKKRQKKAEGLICVKSGGETNCSICADERFSISEVHVSGAHPGSG